MKLVKFVVLAVALLAGAVLGATPAAAATRCARGSNTYSGRCFTSHRIYRHRKVVEAVPLERVALASAREQVPLGGLALGHGSYELGAQRLEFLRRRAGSAGRGWGYPGRLTRAAR